ncbi:MAG: matrixin family metalloprotease [Bacteroidetes bacterium]|nr:matrixin family metalloprotease [Bacteroidota bacterium]
MKYKYLYVTITFLVLLNLITLCDYKQGSSSILFGDKKITIGILPFDDFPQRDLDSVKTSLEKFYGKEVVILEKADLPDMAYTEIRYPRYRADSLLEWMSQRTYDTVDMVIGLTTQDISITKYTDASQTQIKEPEWQYKDFGIFGLGRVGGEVCVVSSNRLSKNVSEQVFYTRLTRIACHEVGHVMGLHHCPNENCLMNDANESIKTIDSSNGELCSDCRNKIE